MTRAEAAALVAAQSGDALDVICRLVAERDELREVAEEIRNEVRTWDHVLDCQRFTDCDEKPPAGDCAYHGEEGCPPCDCGRGIILAALKETKP